MELINEVITSHPMKVAPSSLASQMIQAAVREEADDVGTPADLAVEAFVGVLDQTGRRTAWGEGENVG